jgi:hypothetical protein
MDIFQRNKSLSEREERHDLDSTIFNSGGLLYGHGDLLPKKYVASPILSTPKSLSFPMHSNFVNFPAVAKLKPRKSSPAWYSVVSTLKDNKPPCIPLNLDCHIESDFLTIKAVFNTESELVFSEPPLKKSKIALEPRPFKLKPRAHLRPHQSHQAPSDTTERSVVIVRTPQEEHCGFLPFEQKIRPIEAPTAGHGHDEGSLHAGRGPFLLFNKDKVDSLRTPLSTHISKARAEPTLCWDTPRSVLLLSFPKPHATRHGHSTITSHRRQDDASSMNNHRKECNTVVSQSPWSAFGNTMRCSTLSHSFTRK